MTPQGYNRNVKNFRANDLVFPTNGKEKKRELLSIFRDLRDINKMQGVNLVWIDHSHPRGLLGSGFRLSDRSWLGLITHGAWGAVAVIGSWLLSDRARPVRCLWRLGLWQLHQIGLAKYPCPLQRSTCLCMWLLSCSQASGERRASVCTVSKAVLRTDSLTTVGSAVESTWRLLAVWFKVDTLCHRAQGIQKDVFSQLGQPV